MMVEHSTHTDYKEFNTAELVSLWVAHDRRAADVLINRHYQKALVFCYLYCNGNQNVSEDVVQITFMRISVLIKKYHEDEERMHTLIHHFEAYLHKALKRNIAEYYRNSARHQAKTIPLSDISTSQEPTVHQKNSETTRLVNSALSSLPENQRNALQLFSTGHSYEEIALLMQLTFGQVRGLIQRARYTVRNNLKHLL